MKYLPIGMCAVVLTAGLGHAAHFEPVHEMTWCNSNATVASDTEGPYEDPQSYWAAGYNETSSYNWIDGACDAGSGSDIEVRIDPFTGSYDDDFPPAFYLTANSASYAWLSEPNGVLAEGWSNAQTVAPAYATGNFYRIVPDEGEAPDDSVTLVLSYQGRLAWVSGDRTGTVCGAWIDGGFAGDALLVTRNCQDYDNPRESEILHRYDKLELADNDAVTLIDEVSYSVKIGDIIGIHAATGTHVQRTAGDDETLSASARLDIGVAIGSYDGPAPFTPAKADLTGDGKVDLADYNRFAAAWLWDNGLPPPVTTTLTFESEDDLAQFNQQALGAPADFPWTWRADEGALGGGCLEPSDTATSNTLIYTGRTVDLTTPGQTFTVGMLFKRWDTEYIGIDEAQVGFVHNATQDFHANSGPFMAVNLSAAGNNVLRLDVRYKDGINLVSKMLAAGIVLQDDHWYRLSATFQRLASPNWRVTADLDDYGPDGGGKTNSVVTGATNTYSSSALYGDTEACGAMSAVRHDYSSGGARFVDNFAMTAPQPHPFDPAKADFSRNGKVDLADFVLFAYAWLWLQPLP